MFLSRDMALRSLPQSYGNNLARRIYPPNESSGIYLSHKEQVKRISSDNVNDGKISPNGCRLAYTTTHIDWTGHITQPTLKVIDLCKGEK